MVTINLHLITINDYGWSIILVTIEGYRHSIRDCKDILWFAVAYLIEVISLTCLKHDSHTIAASLTLSHFIKLLLDIIRSSKVDGVVAYRCANLGSLIDVSSTLVIEINLEGILCATCQTVDNKRTLSCSSRIDCSTLDNHSIQKHLVGIDFFSCRPSKC